MVDWSARSTPAPRRETKDAIWMAYRAGRAVELRYCRDRVEAEMRIIEYLSRPGRVLAGFDFGFTFAAWVHHKLRLPPLEFWDWLDARVIDQPHYNNRWAVAEDLNRRLSGGPFPFWATPHPTPLLPAKKPSGYTAECPEWRAPELRVRAMGFRPQPSFKLYTTGSVGSQILLGLPVLARLRRRFGPELAVWPFESVTRRIVLAETYPSMFPLTDPHPVKDASQVLSTVRAMSATLLQSPADKTEEGWILGAAMPPQAGPSEESGPGLNPPRLPG